jgi:cytosine/adenosine deaminase-related metal-dependent hydrolase
MSPGDARGLQGLFLFNGSDAAGRPVCLRIVGGRIAEREPQPGDRQVDLGGDRLLPGLINAHDHLQLNDLPRLKYRPNYENVSQWIADIDPRLHEDPLLRAHGAVPRSQRLLIGGIKNLLSGVTTVAHHDPCYPELSQPSFPVRVLQGHGWSHSLALDGEVAVQQAQRETAPDRPWIIHAAEGIDAAATTEFDRLEALGCIGPHTILVHGVGLSATQRQQLAQSGAGLVWCPGSNLHLFGRTLDVDALSCLPRLALGSDSRISGERDLLAELGLARVLTGWDEGRLEALVTGQAAAMLGLTDRGVLAPGRLADLLVLPAGLPLSHASRTDVRLVLVGGLPRYADPEMAAAFGPTAGLAPVQVDGRPRFLAQTLVSALRDSVLHEPGVSFPARVMEPLS